MYTQEMQMWTIWERKNKVILKLQNEGVFATFFKPLTDNIYVKYENEVGWRRKL